MANRITGKLESLSNIAVIVAAVVLCVVLVRNQFFPSAQPGAPLSAEALKGRTINLDALNPTPAKRNLVLVLSQSCHFCEQEMPFYKSLGEQERGADASLVAVFPQGQPEPEKFLAARSVRADRVVNAPFTDLAGVGGTPTILLVDEKGKIERAWVGALQPDQHKEVLESVRHL